MFSTSFVFFIFAFFFSICLTSCDTAEKNKMPPQINPEDFKEPLIISNKNIVRLEDGDIDFLIKRYKWNMNKSETGLRYFIFEKGGDYKPKTNDEVEIAYTIKKVTGELIYSSKTDGNKKFKVNKSAEIRGLHEAVQLLGKGGKARLIVPSYLAYGLAGDGNLIRERIALIIEIEILNINKSN